MLLLLLLLLFLQIFYEHLTWHIASNDTIISALKKDHVTVIKSNCKLPESSNLVEFSCSCVQKKIYDEIPASANNSSCICVRARTCNERARVREKSSTNVNEPLF